MGKIRTQVHRNVLALLCILAAVLLLGAADQPTWWVEIGWDANTEKDIAGYRIYYRKGDEVEYEYLGETAKNKTGCVVTELEPLIDHIFAVTAYDTGGLESELSKELTFRVNLGDGAGGDSGCFINTIKQER